MFGLRMLAVAGLVAFALTTWPLAIQAEPKAATETRSVEVKVVAAEDSAALSGAKVDVRLDNVSKKLETDEHGIAKFDAATILRFVSMKADAEGRVPLSVHFQRQGDKLDLPATYTFSMEKGTTIGGHIIDHAGAPVAGATVMLAVRKKLPNPNENIGISFLPVTSGADGRWSYDRAPAEFDSISVGVYHHHYASHQPGYGFYTMQEFKPLSSLRDGSATLTLERGVKVEGVVLDPDGKPIKGARVGLGRDRVASNVVPDQATDEQGRFRLAAHSGETTVLSVSREGYAPAQRPISVTEPVEPIELRLEPGQTLKGRVTDAEGQPIAGVRLWGDTWRGARGFHPEAITDAQGRFELKDLPTDDVLYSIHQEGYGSLSQHPMRPGKKDHVITLRPPLTVRGTVADAQTGEPLETFTVIPGIEWGNGQPPYWERRNAKAGKQGEYQQEFTYPRAGHYIRVEAEGYKPAVSRVLKDDEGAVTFDFKLEKGSGVAGRILTPDGKPVDGAKVTLVLPGQGAYIQSGREMNEQGAPIVTTSAEGHYAFPPQEGKWLIVALHDSGYAEIDPVAFEKSADITLGPWARVEGELRIGSKPGAGQKITVYYSNVYDRDVPQVYHHIEAATDEQGKFAIDRAKPGEAYVARNVRINPNSSTYHQAQKLELKAGQTETVTLGGKGRPVVGRVVLPAGAAPINFGYGHSNFSTKVDKDAEPNWPTPKDGEDLEPEAKQKWYNEWIKSDEGQAYQKKQQEVYNRRKHFGFGVQPDGTFRVDDVPAGTYQLSIQVHEPPAGVQCGFGEPVASGTLEFTVPEIPGGQSDDPLDAGTVPLTIVKRLKVGEPAPAFEVATLDEKTIKLDDYQGKYVLLDFWATWCGPCVAETPNLKAVWDAFGKDDRFAMVGLSLDPKPDAPKRYAEKNQLGWTQGYLGDWSKATLPKQYGVQGIPSIWLIGPDGKVIAKDLRGEGIKRAVEAALKN